MANETMQMSASGVLALRRRERPVLRYYNDAANNCTYGIGTLLHTGPCSQAELQRPVTEAEINAQLNKHLITAVSAVKQKVNSATLTQAQFDALVSFTFNVGMTGARATLNAANQGAFKDVITHMQSMVYIHPRDANGRRLSAIRSQGLVNRRREESAPFQTF